LRNEKENTGAWQNINNALLAREEGVEGLLEDDDEDG
jgi:hypothetical protein